jgi:hypothetical protein
MFHKTESLCGPFVVLFCLAVAGVAGILEPLSGLVKDIFGTCVTSLCMLCNFGIFKKNPNFKSFFFENISYKKSN